ncbi:hypothetical protein Tco_1413538, partial [Tanacetum coccineum]
QKSSRDTSPPATDTTNTTPSNGDETVSGSGAETGYGYGSLPGSGITSGSGSESGTGSGSLPGSGTGSGSEALEANGSWLAGLAMGSSTRRAHVKVGTSGCVSQPDWPAV